MNIGVRLIIFELCIKDLHYQLFESGLCLFKIFKGLCLLFLPNVPGAMFIPDSRVMTTYWNSFFGKPNFFKIKSALQLL